MFCRVAESANVLHLHCPLGNKMSWGYQYISTDSLFDAYKHAINCSKFFNKKTFDKYIVIYDSIYFIEYICIDFFSDE